jgi:hypothetical protein
VRVCPAGPSTSRWAAAATQGRCPRLPSSRRPVMCVLGEGRGGGGIQLAHRRAGGCKQRHRGGGGVRGGGIALVSPARNTAGTCFPSRRRPVLGEAQCLAQMVWFVGVSVLVCRCAGVSVCRCPLLCLCLCCVVCVVSYVLCVCARAYAAGAVAEDARRPPALVPTHLYWAHSLTRRARPDACTGPESPVLTSGACTGPTRRARPDVKRRNNSIFNSPHANPPGVAQDPRRPRVPGHCPT